MNPSPSNQVVRLDWAVASRCAPGETCSGDLHLVKHFPGGALAAVVDGLGHGADAHCAAQAAITVLDAHAGEPVVPLVERCQAALKTTRGVVMTLVSFDFAARGATALGVGNVCAVLVRADPRATPAREYVLQRSGIVGDQLPALHATRFELRDGDTWVFATDGVRDGFGEELTSSDSPQHIADRVLDHGFRGNDDALVLVVRHFL